MCPRKSRDRLGAGGEATVWKGYAQNYGIVVAVREFHFKQDEEDMIEDIRKVRF